MTDWLSKGITFLVLLWDFSWIGNDWWRFSQWQLWLWLLKLALACHLVLSLSCQWAMLNTLLYKYWTAGLNKTADSYNLEMIIMWCLNLCRPNKYYNMYEISQGIITYLEILDLCFIMEHKKDGNMLKLNSITATLILQNLKKKQHSHTHTDKWAWIWL